MIQIKHVFNHLGARNNEIKKLLNTVISESYMKTEDLIERELRHCKDIYLGIKNEEVICFFMVSWDNHIHKGKDNTLVYMGLSGCKENFKSLGHIKYCYDAFINDAIKWEVENSKKLTLWATTATPFAYLAAHKLFTNLNPDINGSFTNKSEDIAYIIRKKYYKKHDKKKCENPFILKHVASDTIYSLRESERINNIVSKKRFSLFEKFGVDETIGDRLIMIMETPGSNSVYTQSKL